MSDCVPKAIAHVTGRDLSEVWPVCLRAGWTESFGMHAGHKVRALKELGWDGGKLRFDLCGLTIAQLERRLRDTGEDARLMLDVYCGSELHVVSYADGELKNTLGMRRARVRSAYAHEPALSPEAAPAGEADPDETPGMRM